MGILVKCYFKLGDLTIGILKGQCFREKNWPIQEGIKRLAISREIETLVSNTSHHSSRRNHCLSVISKKKLG
jgi:hypothetical protein